LGDFPYYSDQPSVIIYLADYLKRVISAAQILVKLIISLYLFKMPYFNGYVKKMHALMHLRLAR